MRTRDYSGGEHTGGQLVALTAAGDQAAFEELVGRHEMMVFSVCMRMLRNREDALDAVQEVFLSVFAKAAQFRRESAPSTWIYRIAVNTCLDLLRKQRRRVQYVRMEEWFERPDPYPDGALEAVEARLDLAGPLGALPAHLRCTVMLADAEGRPLLEVAAITGVPVGTVKSRLSRARQQLARALAEKTSHSHEESAAEVAA